ncbi:DNA primase large subunit [Mucidula mucida]|nr:DNA primase large subunit [Mucidula mucida]
MCLDRLRILAEIESSSARGRSWDDTKTVIGDQCKKYLPLSATSAISVDRDTERRKDHLGHFVLRLAFCRSDDLRQRFIKAESTLFRLRYDTDGVEERKEFLGTRNFNWIAVSKEEKSNYSEQLLAAYQGFKNETEKQNAFKSDTFYKVKWTRVPDLVKKRKVFLKAGWAYVPGREQSSIVFQAFESELEKALLMTAKSLPRLDEDTRLLPVLNNLSQGFMAGVSSDWGGSGTEVDGDKITADMIDGYAKKHFPLCMRSMHSQLMRDHHLKHFGRLDYGLFLKRLGVSLEEALIFWRKSFMGGKVTDDRFNKEYAYNVRHSYGKEGKRADYPAKTCMQLLTGSSEYGCPYRFLTPENLQTSLVSAYAPLGLQHSDLPEILHTKKDSKFHLGCTRVFEITHASCGVKKGEGVGAGETVSHPNQYALRSIELEKAKDGRGTAMDVDG